MPTETITSADLLVVGTRVQNGTRFVYKPSLQPSYQAALAAAQYYTDHHQIACAILNRIPAGWTVLHTTGSLDSHPGLLDLVLTAAERWEEDRFANLAAEAE